MPTKEIKIKVFECSKCKHTWQERKRKHDTPKPALCPKCKSPYWDYEKKSIGTHAD